MAELVEVPDVQEFNCVGCGKSCRLHPKAKPMNVQHSEPVCSLWKRIQNAGSAVAPAMLAHFLVNSGVPVAILPQA